MAVKLKNVGEIISASNKSTVLDYSPVAASAGTNVDVAPLFASPDTFTNAVSKILTIAAPIAINGNNVALTVPSNMAGTLDIQNAGTITGSRGNGGNAGSAASAGGNGGAGGAAISVQSNGVTLNNDPTAHAEIVAIRDACAKKKTFDLKGHVIFSSCEPCPMCLSAIYWARIDKIFYANSRMDAQKIGFDDNEIYGELAKHVDQRRIKMVRVPDKISSLAFLDWEQKIDKVEY